MRPWEKYITPEGEAKRGFLGTDEAAWELWMTEQVRERLLGKLWGNMDWMERAELYNVMCGLADGAPDESTYATVQHACWIKSCPNWGRWIDDKCPRCGCTPGDAEEVLVQTAPVQ